jgi:integrase
MKGTLDRLPSGRWRLRVQVAGHRHQRTVSARTKRDAQLALAEFVAEIGAVPDDGHGITVAQLLAHHQRQAQWQATTRARRVELFERLPAWFVALEVAAVRPATLQRLWADVDATAHGKATLHSALAAAWKRAVALGWIAASPFTAVRPPTPRRAQISPPSPEMVRRAVAASAAAAPWQPVAFTIAATTGMRRGELCGLQWGDVDLQAGQLTVARSVAYTPRAGVVVKSTKTGTVRTIALDDTTLGLLAEHRAQAETLAGLLGLSEVESGHFVFPAAGDPRRPCRPDNLTQAWERACARAGVTGVRLHDLRHFTATQLLGAGVDVRTVAGRLGHARTSTTLDRYGAFMPARDRDAAELLGRLVG